MSIKIGDKIKQRRDLVTVWIGPNGSSKSNSETVYTVTNVFSSGFTGELYLNADDGNKYTGGPVDSYTKA